VAEIISDEEADTVTPQKLQASATRSRRLSVEELMVHGESGTVEFKSSARWNLHTGDRDQAIEREIVKAVSGFMNAQGGTLLIGVNDSHEAVGLQNDYKLCRKGNCDSRDSFENWLTDLFDNSIGRPALLNENFRYRQSVSCRCRALDDNFDDNRADLHWPSATTLRCSRARNQRI
jgi:hypothetical protein